MWVKLQSFVQLKSSVEGIGEGTESLEVEYVGKDAYVWIEIADTKIDFEGAVKNDRQIGVLTK